MPWRGRHRRAWFVLALPLLLAACSISTEASPHVIPPRNVPFHLLEPAPTTTVIGGPAEHATIYLAGLQHLATVTRLIPAPATASAVLAALSRGPTSAEAATNLRSPISTAAPMSIGSVRGSLVTVRLPATFDNLAGRDQIIAVAQLVYTLTALPGIDDVKVVVGGHPAKLPTADGSLTRDPVTRADYASLAAP